jgi:hypothetical protein
LTEERQILKSASVIRLVATIGQIHGHFRDQRLTLPLGTSVGADSFILVTALHPFNMMLMGRTWNN